MTKAGFIESVDARTKLAGSNQMEVLLFSLGTREIFGINVFKVREVGKIPAITRTPNMPTGVEGLISLRGNVIPVVALVSLLNLLEQSLPELSDYLGDTMLVTEFSRRTIVFMVKGVDRIHRVDWERIRPADNGGLKSLVTAIIELSDGRIVSMLDVEQILANTFGDAVIADVLPLQSQGKPPVVFFADDSLVARKQIAEVLDHLKVKHKHATDGQEAWTRLQATAVHCQQIGKTVKDEIDLILVDAEMPQMDGYVLTRNIKADPRFDGIPVVMHSSLSSEANKALGRQVGVDAYVAKFDSGSLGNTLRPYLQH
ncbi:MAG: chemotaxis protein [Deltaproteobacteria bacterium]|nr:chemotaxis protein [Deltaproteobacteria bacterium]